jgi:hypothetical protein
MEYGEHWYTVCSNTVRRRNAVKKKMNRITQLDPVQATRQIFTNYVNHVAQTVVDFPEVKPGNGQASTGTFDVSGGHNH